MSGKIYCFVNDQKDGMFTVVALQDDGHLIHPGAQFRSVALAKERMAVDFKDHDAVWVDNPNKHVGVLKACRLYEEMEAQREEAEQEEAKGTVQRILEDPELEPEAKVAIKAGLHLCETCSHSPVCGTAIAARLQEQMGGLLVISACMHHAPEKKEEDGVHRQS